MNATRFFYMHRIFQKVSVEYFGMTAMQMIRIYQLEAP